MPSCAVRFADDNGEQRATGGNNMRAFLLACVALVAIGAGGYFILNSQQQASGAAFSTSATRISPSWSWRVALTTPSAENCEPRASWQWFFVDFRHPGGESKVCSDSQ
jgi:hypothetical protein